MFGLMKVSTHKAVIDAKDAYRADLKLANQMMANERDAAKTRASTAEAEVVTLKARIAELERLLPLPKRKPVGSGSVKSDGKGVSINAAKVPVKGKVEAKSGKVTK